MRSRTRFSDLSIQGLKTEWNKSYDPSKGWVYNPNPTPSTVRFSGSFVEETQDGVHDWPPKGGDANRDIGGVFSSSKSRTTYSAPSVTTYWDGDIAKYTRYVGPIPAPVVEPGTSLGDRSSESQLNAFGSTAVSRSIPTAPAANVSVMLAELFREGVPKAVGATLLRNRFRDYRDIGGEYLNVKFGWEPIVADLKSVSKAMVDSEKILSQLERDSGRLVRRRFAFPSITQSSTASGVTTHPVQQYLPSGMAWNAESATVYRTFEQRRWFSGAFTYHVEPSSSRRPMMAAAQKARLLLGLELTPETVWNLTPWSWMMDWVTNAGDVMTNVSRFAQDGLVMRYGYIMEETTSMAQLTQKRIGMMAASGKTGDPRQYVSPTTTRTLNYKVRQPATPFGFGLREEGFDPRQWAILGALGISRGPSKL